MVRSRIAFAGAGSFSDGVLPMLSKDKYEFVGYFDDKNITEYRGFPVFGKLSDVVIALDKGVIDGVFVTIGENQKRKEIFNLIAEKHYDKIINIISDKANVYDETAIRGRGVFIGFSSFIGADSYVEDNSIIQTGSIVEHHTIVHKHCNITPGVTINGLCDIGEGAYIGSGSTVIQLIRIAPYTILGAGSVVLKPIEHPGTYVGVPAKKIK